MSVTEEEAKIEAGKVQSYYNNISTDVFSSDPFFKLFKKIELDATMSAGSTGAYHSYWDMTKITDLNDRVDAEPSCPKKLKDIFSSGSRNPRIRGNRVGQAVFDHSRQLMNSTPQESSGATPNANPPPSSVPKTTTPTPTPSSEKLLEGRTLVQYKFSPELPAAAQLRVRSAPSMEGDAIGTVQASDVIMGAPEVRSGDWLRVQIQGWATEAWILTQMGQTTLLVTVDTQPDSTQPPPQQQMAPPPQQQMVPPPQQQPPIQSASVGSSPTHEHHRPHSSPVRSMVNTSTGRSFFQDPSMGVAQSLQGGGGGGGSYENMNQSMMQMSMPNVNMSTMMGNTTLMGGGQPMEGQPVPYELYRRLEIRVNRLEADLNNLKMALRSI